MSEKYLGQIMMAGFNFAPRGSAFCSGQLLGIAQNSALFALLGTTYGGNGQTTFALPDLRGRTPVGFASSAVGSPLSPVMLGEAGGVENVTLLNSQIPSHVHGVNASLDPGTTRNPTNALYAITPTPLHGPATGNLVPLAPGTVALTGGGQPHPNMQPYLGVNFCIFLEGIFPSRN